MASLQSQFLRHCLGYIKSTTNWSAPIAQQRRLAEDHACYAHMPNRVQVTRLAEGEIAGEWLHPQLYPYPDRVLLYLHGGGYVIGSCNTHRALAAHIAMESYADLLLPEYRLAPEHPFPAALIDAVTAYRWLLEQGYPPEQIVLAGDSAGGGLAIAALLELRELGLPLPAAVVCISPLTDAAGRGESMTTNLHRDPWLTPESNRFLLTHYLDGQSPRHPLISPIHAKLDGLPPLLIQVGSDEILLSDSLRLADVARASGVEVTLRIWPQMWHVFHLMTPALPEAEEAIHEIGVFVQHRTAGNGEK